MKIAGLSVAIGTGRNYKVLYRLGFKNEEVDCVKWLTELTGFLFKKMYRHFVGTKKRSLKKKGWPIRWGSTEYAGMVYKILTDMFFISCIVVLKTSGQDSTSVMPMQTSKLCNKMDL